MKVGTLSSQKALQTKDQKTGTCIGLDGDSAPMYVLQAQIAKDMGMDFAVKEFLDIANKRFPKLTDQDECELGWYITASEMRDDEDTASEASLERSQRKAGIATTRNESQGQLLMMAA